MSQVRQRTLMLAFFFLLFARAQMRSQGMQTPGDPCKPVGQRTQEVGCWILADDAIGQLSSPKVFWFLDAYATRAAAQADKGPQGIVVESMGKIWLMTIEQENWKSAHGTRIGAVGPIPITAGERYSAQFMEAVFLPGMMAPEHFHSGPEAWFNTAGETCLETSDGRMQIGRPGGPPVVVPAGMAMHLTAIGTEERRSIVLILHDSSKPPTTMTHDWTAKGLCKTVH
jgi:hypothetical protein